MRMIGLLVLVGIASTAYSQGEPPPVSVAERAELYRRIAELESTAELERLAREAAAATDAAGQSSLGLILDRYFELDPSGAVQLAGQLLPRSSVFLGALYERLARADINAALAALSQVDALDEARIASIAVLRGLGGDERAFDLIAASLQGGARDQFRADALLQIAASSPQRAFDEALAIADTARRGALASAVVARWASDAPTAAIAAVERVPDPELRAALRATVLRSWRDTDSLVAYLNTLAPEARNEAVASGALEALAQADPRRAAEIAAALPPGEERTRRLAQITFIYAQRDADAALAWARTLDPPEPELVASAVRHIGAREPLRAFDLAATLDEPQRTQISVALVNAVNTDEAQWSRLAERVLRVEDEQLRTRLVMSLIDTWTNRRRDPTGALDWMLASEASLPAEAFERVAFTYARTDPSAAAGYVDRVPSRVRAAWIAAVTIGHATTDVPGAMQFLDRFRGEPGFDRGAVMLAQQMAASDPPAAARLLASVGTRGPDGASPEFAIARSWAERDPAAAAAWAIGLPPLQRSMAISIVAGSWGARDPDAARQWALGLPPGDPRDQALGAVMRTRGTAPPDAALLGAFSNDRARQAAMMNMIMQTAQTDVAAARRLLAEHITEPRMRAQAEQMIDSFARGTAPLPAGFPGQMPVVRSPVGVTPGGLYGPATIIGPDGRPLPVRPPEPGLVPLPPGAFLGPIPPIPPAPEVRPERPSTGDRQ